MLAMRFSKSKWRPVTPLSIAYAILSVTALRPAGKPVRARPSTPGKDTVSLRQRPPPKHENDRKAPRKRAPPLPV